MKISDTVISKIVFNVLVTFYLSAFSSPRYIISISSYFELFSLCVKIVFTAHNYEWKGVFWSEKIYTVLHSTQILLSTIFLRGLKPCCYRLLESTIPNRVCSETCITRAYCERKQYWNHGMPILYFICSFLVVLIWRAQSHRNRHYTLLGFVYDLKQWCMVLWNLIDSQRFCW